MGIVLVVMGAVSVGGEPIVPKSIQMIYTLSLRCGQAQSVPFWSGALVPEWDRHRSKLSFVDPVDVMDPTR